MISDVNSTVDFSRTKQIKIDLPSNELNLNGSLEAYHIHSLYNIENPEQADFFFLGDSHLNPAITASHGEVIKALAQLGPVTLVLEGWHAKEPILDIEPVLDHYSIPLELQTNIFGFGWDGYKVAELEKDYHIPCSMLSLLKALKQTQEEGNMIMNLLKLHFPFVLKVIDAPEEFNKSVLSLEANDPSSFSFFLNLTDIQALNNEEQKKIQSLIDAKPILPDEVSNDLELKRNECHILSIKHFKSRFENKEIVGKVVFIQGTDHLRLSQYLFGESLDKLHKELQSLKAAVLIHKDIGKVPGISSDVNSFFNMGSLKVSN